VNSSWSTTLKLINLDAPQLCSPATTNASVVLYNDQDMLLGNVYIRLILVLLFLSKLV